MPDAPDNPVSSALPASSWGWFLRGAAQLASTPAFILMATVAGFGGIAREAGLSLGETVFGVFLVWALPNLLVLVGGMMSDLSLPAIMIAVALSAVRLLPMTIAFVPLIRGPQTPRWQLHVSAHFVAVTAWIVAMMKLPALPRQARFFYFIGFALPLAMICAGLAGGAHMAIASIPPILAASLYFMTPVYFITALWAAARHAVDKIAMVAGLILGPVFHYLEPQFDVLWAGLLGGTLAVVVARIGGRL